jgi:hypothetical protein
MKTVCPRLASILWFFAATPAFARPVAELPELPEQLPFELVVHPQHPLRPGQRPAAGKLVHITPGESLGLTFELKYTGDTPVTIFWGRSPYNSWVRLTIKTPSGRKLVTSYNDPELQPQLAGENEVVTLQKSDTVRGRFIIGGTRVQEFQLREPGDYKLTATVGLHEAEGDQKRAESWTLRGRVSAPEVSFHVDDGNDPVAAFRTVKGRVVDADGAPVARADVSLHVERTAMSSVLMEKRFQSHDWTVTDAQGRFEFPRLPANEPRLMLGVLHQSLPPTHKVVAVDPASEVVDVELSLGRGRTVSGTVVDRQGTPLVGVHVGRPPVPWKYLPGTAVTDAAGKFTVEGVATETASWIQAHRRDLEVVDKSNQLEAGAGPASMTIVMQPMDREVAKLSGVARFDNGQPAGDLELTMWIDHGKEVWAEQQCVTAGDGQFTIELNHKLAGFEGPLQGLVEVAQPAAPWPGRPGQPEAAVPGKSFSDKHTPRSRWMTAFEVPAGQRHVELTFHREHTIRLKLTSASALPAELDVLVTLEATPSRFHSRCIASEMLAGNRLTDLDYRDLTPGRYRVRVDLTLDRRFHFRDKWEQEVVIAADAGTTEHEVVIRIPELEFGSVKVQVRNAEGRPPAGSTWLSMHANEARGSVEVVDGVAHFPVVPAGPLSVSYSPRDGVTAVPLRHELAAGEEVTLGPLVLRPVEELYGHVSGRVVLADGTPALGAAVNLQSMLSSSGFRVLGGSRVDGNGRFRCSAPPQNRYLVVDLSACDLWPPGSATEKAESPGSGFSGFGRLEAQLSSRDLVYLVKLVAGQEQALDIVLPEVDFRDVEIELPVEKGQHTHAALWADLGNVQLHQTPVFTNGRATLHFVPDVPSQVIVGVWETAPGTNIRQRYSAAMPVERGASPVVRCDPSQAGQLTLRATGREGAAEVPTYRVRPTDWKLPASLSTLPGVPTRVAGITGEDGTSGEDDHTVLRLAPGRYTVTASCDGVEREQIVELNPADQQELVFDFTAP